MKLQEILRKWDGSKNGIIEDGNWDGFFNYVKVDNSKVEMTSQSPVAHQHGDVCEGNAWVWSPEAAKK